MAQIRGFCIFFLIWACRRGGEQPTTSSQPSPAPRLSRARTPPRGCSATKLLPLSGQLKENDYPYCPGGTPSQ